MGRREPSRIPPRAPRRRTNGASTVGASYPWRGSRSVPRWHLRSRHVSVLHTEPHADPSYLLPRPLAIAPRETRGAGVSACSSQGPPEAPATAIAARSVPGTSRKHGAPGSGPTPNRCRTARLPLRLPAPAGPGRPRVALPLPPHVPRRPARVVLLTHDGGGPRLAATEPPERLGRRPRRFLRGLPRPRPPQVDAGRLTTRRAGPGPAAARAAQARRDPPEEPDGPGRPSPVRCARPRPAAQGRRARRRRRPRVSTPTAEEAAPPRARLVGVGRRAPPPAEAAAPGRPRPRAPGSPPALLAVVPLLPVARGDLARSGRPPPAARGQVPVAAGEEPAQERPRAPPNAGVLPGPAVGKAAARRPPTPGSAHAPLRLDCLWAAGGRRRRGRGLFSEPYPHPRPDTFPSPGFWGTHVPMCAQRSRVDGPVLCQRRTTGPSSIETRPAVP